MNRWLSPFIVMLLQVSVIQAQGTKADYARSSGLAEQYTGKVLNTRPRVTWSADGLHAYYRQQRPGNASRFLKVDLKTAVKSDAFDHDRLAVEIA
ncbi:MAG TPA: hypothetical protein PLX97_07065, partial [Gemmatales bacterium]|nr:hypothetical protein [Gemmatales bacterium]